ncbi:histone deacetylase 8-like [Mytilus edulis]|uniref:histone deacetylase 8-like n=1 Tax=Mytilus edulis TaxID=6550 RepID=UPI0039F12F24
METDILDGVQRDSTDIIDGVERDSKESLNSKSVDTLEPDENCVPTVINKAPEHAESNIKSDKNDTNTENDQADRNTILEACETKLNSSTSSGKNENVEKSSEDLEFKPHTLLTNEKTILDHASVNVDDKDETCQKFPQETISSLTNEKTILDHASINVDDQDATYQKRLKDTIQPMSSCSENQQSFDSLHLNVDDRILSSEKLQKAVDKIIEEDMEIDSSDVPHDQDKTDPCELLKDSSLCSLEVKYISGKDKVDKPEVKDDIYDIDNDVHQEATNTPSLQKLRKDQKKERSIFQGQENSCQAAGDKTSDDSSIKQLECINTNLKPVSELGINKLGHSTQSKNSEDESEKQRKEKLSNIVDKKNKSQKVVYVYSKELIQICDQMQKIPCRASMVHSLIEAYGLTRYMRVVEPREATERELLAFHDLDYIEFIKKISNHDDSEKFEDEATHYGLSYDCPLQQGLYKYATMSSGATIVAAECLLQETCKVAINWCGGWHHAAKDHASGFCYINDIVLGILKLKEKYDRILYVDLDLHHGDGVEDAFSATSKVMTVSFHKYLTGFFPGTGSLEDIGIGKGQYYTVNVPLLDGIKDTEFTPLVCRILNKVKETFRPEVVVCQCGADGLAGDPMESFNLTHKGLGKCLYFLLQWNLPTLVLGGGGYNLSNTARCWAFLTALATGKQIPTEIPDHEYFIEYGPDYELEVYPGNRKNHNTAHYLRQVYGAVLNNISKICTEKC